MKADLWVTADVTPGFDSGGDSYANADLAVYTYSVEQKGVGTLQPDVDIQFLSSGGFQFINGYIIQANDAFCIHYQNQSYDIVESNYSNGFDIAKVLPTLKGRIGWRQSKKQNAVTLNSLNLQSSSGRYFQGFHSMVTVDNIKSAQEDNLISDEDMNDFLQKLQEDGIMRTLTEVFRERELLEQKLMYTRFGFMDIPMDNSGLFIGYIINIANTHDVSTQINFATLYFDSDVDFNLYVFRDGIKLPWKTIPVSVKAYERTQILFDTLVLPFEIGRKYYIGYFQDDLGTAKGIREQVDTWATTYNFEAYPIAAPAITGEIDFNHNYRQYPFLPYGMNLEIISFKDHTQKILRSPNLFDEAQGLTVAMMVLELITTSSRFNLNERQNKQLSQQLFMEINQAFPTKEMPITGGLKSRLFSEYKKLRETFYPKKQPFSSSMETSAFSVDSAWIKGNIKQITNPPMMKQ